MDVSVKAISDRMDGEAHVPRYSRHVSAFLNEIGQDVTQREGATEEHERLTKSRLNAVKQKKKIEEKIKKMIQDLEHQNEVITACQARLFEIEQQYPELNHLRNRKNIWRSL